MAGWHDQGAQIAFIVYFLLIVLTLIAAFLGWATGVWAAGKRGGESPSGSRLMDAGLGITGFYLGMGALFLLSSTNWIDDMEGYFIFFTLVGGPILTVLAKHALLSRLRSRASSR